MKTYIYLIEVFNYQINKEPSHYVLNAWKDKEEAIKEAEALMEMYKKDGYDIHKQTQYNTNHIGWINNGEESKHYWINEIQLI